MCLPFGPTTSSTSASSNSCSTPSPTPTLNASRPSFAAPTSSPSTSCTDKGSSSMQSSLAATDAADTVLMRLVLLSSMDDFALATVPTGPDEAGGPPPSSSTDYGTTSETAKKLFGDFAGNGFVSGLEIGGTAVFVMPGPYESASTANKTLSELAKHLQ